MNNDWDRCNEDRTEPLSVEVAVTNNRNGFGKSKSSATPVYARKSATQQDNISNRNFWPIKDSCDTHVILITFDQRCTTALFVD